MKVREILKLLEEDGWYLVRTKGSHRQFKHSSKPVLFPSLGNPGLMYHPAL
jgi:predicted RNA binding protein YcfA (HicA-like mRNA interferase family)